MERAAVRATIDAAGHAEMTRGDLDAAISAVPQVSVGVALDSEACAELLALSLAAAAPPGSVLTSRAIAAATSGGIAELPPMRLATLSPPEAVFARGLSDIAPRGLDGVDHDLPLRHASFVGRTTDVITIVSSIALGGITTVTGTGGVGKTETALRAAGVAAMRSFAAFRTVELASLTADDVSAALDDAVDATASRPLLLLVDNAEHVVDAVRAWVGRRDRSDMALLVTSRAPLRVVDERVVVLPLLAPSDAAVLFADRAARAGGAPGDPASVSALCEQLDFLPLAIELAAARSRVLSAAAMTERLADRFRLLPTQPDASVPHHRSLEAAIAWSYDLLDESDRGAFRRLAVFADRFDLTQAEAVGVDLDALGRLIDQSLVAAEPESDYPYRLLDSVRAFAVGALRDSDDESTARDGLLAWLDGVSAVFDAADNARRAAAHHALDGVPTDVRHALEHATTADPARAVAVFGRIGAWFWDRGRAAEGVALADAVLAADPGDDPLSTARLVNALANLHVRAGDPDRAVPYYERALSLRTANHVAASQLASTHNDFGTCLLHLGQFDAARTHLDQARTGYAEAGDRWGVATAATNLAALAVTRGELDGAAEQFARAAEEFTHMDDFAQAAAARTNEGLVLLELGDERAGAVLATAAREVMRAGVRSILPHVLAGAASLALAGGDAERAAQLWGAARAIGHIDDESELEAKLGDAVGWDRLDELAGRGGRASDEALLAWVDGAADAAPAGTAELRRAPDGWQVVFAGETALLPALRGVDYLARLLDAPRTEVHVADLAGVAVAQPGTAVADEAALAAYRSRVAELRRMLDDADARGDAGAGIEAQAELDHLMAELRRATDRRGHVRLTGGDSERARKAVTNRIRDAIRVAAEAHPALGRHLDHAVKTGTYCEYSPEHDVAWTVVSA